MRLLLAVLPASVVAVLLKAWPVLATTRVECPSCPFCP